jgi:serine/threonine protein kinase
LEVAEGIAALHACSIAHCDLKQENVLVVSHQERGVICKISDFGHSISTGVEAGRFVVNLP